MRKVVALVATIYVCVAVASIRGGVRSGKNTGPPVVGFASVTVEAKAVFHEEVVADGWSVPVRPRLASTHGCVGYDRWGNPR